MLQNFDYKMIQDSIVDQYSWVLSDPRFKVQNLTKISRALSNIAAWILSLIRFKRASNQVDGLKQDMEE